VTTADGRFDFLPTGEVTPDGTTEGCRVFAWQPHQRQSADLSLLSSLIDGTSTLGGLSAKMALYNADRRIQPGEHTRAELDVVESYVAQQQRMGRWRG